MRAWKIHVCAGILLTAIILMVGAGCQQDTPSIIASWPLSFQGSVTLSTDSYTSQPEYVVEIVVRNDSSSSLIFSVAEGAFLNRNGKGLRVKTTYPQGAVTLGVGEEKDFSFNTDGYTYSLIADKEAAGGSLYFQLTLLRGERVVAGPYIAPLPGLEALSGSVRLEFTEGGW